jgi:hypothetical protein
MMLARKWLSLPKAKQQLLFKSALVLGAVRVGLAFLPIHTLLRMQAYLSSRRAWMHAQGDASSPEQIGWAVSVVGRHVPGTRTCLIQALAVHALLQRSGFSPLLCIGVARTSGCPLQAHAWVEHQGQVVIGGGVRSLYAPLFVWKGRSL